MELKLKNVTSYKKNDFTSINLGKKVNILYGHNGCGKSTISNYFYNPTLADYHECECTFINDFRPLVYNSKFIEDNFYNSREQKGVFTLSKENADIEKQILEKEDLREVLRRKYLEEKEKIEKVKGDFEKVEEDCIKSIWDKTDFVKSSVLKVFMKGLLGNKIKFFSHLKKTPPLSGVDLKLLADEYADLLKYKNKPLPLITSFVKSLVLDEDKKLLETPIIDSSNSYLSETIKKLQNLDWVKKGKEVYLNGSTCPFCQEKTISANFLSAIESIFDESYAKSVEKISYIKLNYEFATKQHLNKISQEVGECELVSGEEKEKILSYIKILSALADKNLDFISEKIKNPSTVISLEYDDVTEVNLVKSIEKLNNDIGKINAKVKQFKISENAIGGKVWGAVRDFCTTDFENLSKYETSYQDELKKLHASMTEIEKKGRENTEEIKNLRDMVSNIDSTIESINARLKSLGIHGFGIKKHTESKDKYIISRTDNPSSVNVYKSLSEGEKTLITFLYFLECCKGKTDKDDSDTRDTFIVIDDPISSLSQNYVFDIASMIHHEIIKGDSTKKILILTHNLYFFHELIKLAPKGKGDKVFNRDYYLGRITKNEFSIITEIKKNSIQNEYQSLWQILKDAKEGRVNKVIIPNIMRNILEYYFAFVHKTDSLQNELAKLASDDNNSDFRAFYRYINRGSHSDAVNITDMGDIAPEKYIEQLKKIFSMTGDEKHYFNMMEDDEEEIVTA